jgi:transcriptional regulator GlxA family with amidase domain
MDARILTIIALIRAEPVPCLKVTELAALVGLSRSRLALLFKKHTGETLKNRLRRLRLQKAKSLLADYRSSIKEVAAQSGYSSAAHFTHDFRKAFDLSPSDYRRSTF